MKSKKSTRQWRQLVKRFKKGKDKVKLVINSSVIFRIYANINSANDGICV